MTLALPRKVVEWADAEFSYLSGEEQAELVLMAILLARGSWRPALDARPITTLHGALARLRRALQDEQRQIAG